MIELTVTTDTFRLASVWTISRGSRTEVNVVTVTLRQDGRTGRGECVPYPRYGESVESVCRQITEAAASLTAAITNEELLSIMPPGAARNAVDCALWDLRAKQVGKPVWQLAGLPARPEPVMTTYSLSLDTPQAMGDSASQHASRPLLKVKLGGGDEDIERIRAVRANAPDTDIIIDANEGWTVEDYLKLSPTLLDLGVSMVEQPLPAGSDDALLEIKRTLPVCADESVHDTATLSSLQGKYDMVNIKLDKTGGLTEALKLQQATREAGLGVMVGCMMGTSLVIAPAALVAQDADYVDLDAPLLLAEDRQHPLVYLGAMLQPPPAALWGSPL